MATHRRVGVVALHFSLAWALCGTAAGDPRTAVAGKSCVQAEAVSGSVLADNFVASVDELQTNVSAKGYGTSTSGASGPNKVFGLGQCFHDLTPADCKLCFTEVIRSLLPTCYPRVGGRLFADGCFGRYDNYSFFGEAVGPSDIFVCGSASDDISRLEGFSKVVNNAVAKVTKEATRRNGYAVGSAEAVGARAFVQAQCWESLSKTACDQCLEAARYAVLQTCVPAMEGRALNTGCYLRYSTRLFWNVNATTGSGPSGYKDVGLHRAILCHKLKIRVESLFGLLHRLILQRRNADHIPNRRNSTPGISDCVDSIHNVESFWLNAHDSVASTPSTTSTLGYA